MIDIPLAPGSYLTPISIFKNQRRRSSYICQCICGKEVKAGAYELKRGSIKSCGCKKTEMLNNCNSRRAYSFQNYKLRWDKLEELGARSPSLQKYLSEIAKEYPVYV